MTTTQILGFVATGLVIVGYIPQIVHLIKERCTAGISISAFSLWCTASLLFLIHAAVDLTPSAVRSLRETSRPGLSGARHRAVL